MKARRSAGARTEDGPTQRSRGAEPPVATGPRSCQSGRNPGGISPGFRWESHCRLLSSGGPEESGEAGWGGRREGAGGGAGGGAGEEEEEDPGREAAAREEEAAAEEGRRGGATSPARTRSSPDTPGAPAARVALPRRSAPKLQLQLHSEPSNLFLKKIRKGAATQGRSPRRSKTTG